MKALDVSPLDAELLNATLRLVRMVGAPGEYAVLAPLVVRELVYRLLTGAQGDRLRHLATVGGHAHRMARAVRRLRDDFEQAAADRRDRPRAGHERVGFHAHFKAVTAMSRCGSRSSCGSRRHGG